MLRSRTRVSLTVATAVLLVGGLVGVAPTAATQDLDSLERVDSAATADGLTFTAALPYDRRALMRAARAVSTPGRPQYRAFRDLSGAAAEFGAGRSEVRALERVAAGLGIDVEVSPTGLTANLTASVDTWTGLYGTQISGYLVNTWLSIGFFADDGTALPTPAPLASVVREVIPSMAILDQPEGGGAVRSATSAPPMNSGTPFGPGAECLSEEMREETYSPSQLQVPYGTAALHEAGLRGRGVRLANLAGSYAFGQDLVDFAADCFEFPAPTITFTGGPGVGPDPVITGGELEGNLDVQTIAPVIPAADSFGFVQIANNQVTYLEFVQGIDTLLTQVSPMPDVVTMSFGACERELRDEAKFRRIADDHFAFAGLLGMTVLAASGDGGSSDCAQFVDDPTPEQRLQSVQYPASSPWVTGVGGTRITLGEGNVRVSEVVWNDSPWGFIAGGTGGPSLNPRPWYQRGVTPRDRRSVPDIVAHSSAFPGWPVAAPGADGPAFISVAGTSAAAPFSAANIALIAAAERRAGRGPLGFLNPLLYTIAADEAEYRRTFVDIVAGTNQLYIEAGCCIATRGFDAATGLGAINFDVLRDSIPPPGRRALR